MSTAPNPVTAGLRHEAEAAETAECTQCPQLDDMLGEVIADRDRLAELLDEMTAAVAASLCCEFGEHSSANDPWRNAIRALRGQEP